MAECKHGLDEEWCSSCLHGPSPTPDAVEATFGARFEGECPTCGRSIDVGQIIHRLVSGRYVHAGCQP